MISTMYKSGLNMECIISNLKLLQGLRYVDLDSGQLTWKTLYFHKIVVAYSVIQLFIDKVIYGKRRFSRLSLWIFSSSKWIYQIKWIKLFSFFSSFSLILRPFYHHFWFSLKPGDDLVIESGPHMMASFYALSRETMEKIDHYSQELRFEVDRLLNFTYYPVALASFAFFIFIYKVISPNISLSLFPR